MSGIWNLILYAIYAQP